MGFFSGLMKTLGFEGDDTSNSQKQNKKSEQNNTQKAEFDLKNMPQRENIREFTPVNQVEIQEITEVLKENECVCVNMQKLDNINYIRSLDFLSGAIFVLNGKIKKSGDKIYIFYPNTNE